MVQSDFFDIIDEEENLEPRQGLVTALLVLGTVFMGIAIVLVLVAHNSLDVF